MMSEAQSKKRSREGVTAGGDQPLQKKANTVVGNEQGMTRFENGFNNRWVVRLRGLPFSATAEQIIGFFGETKPEKVCIAKLANGRPSGEALVEFDDYDKLVFAHTLHNKPFRENDRYIEVFDGTPDAIDVASGTKTRNVDEQISDEKNVVVKLRGLPFTAGHSEIEQFLLLRQLRAQKIHLVKDRIGRPSGMCYIEFSSQEQADEANSLNRAFMGNRYIEVFPSSHKELQRDVMEGIMVFMNNGNYNRGGGGIGMPAPRGRSAPRGRNVYRGGLGYPVGAAISMGRGQGGGGGGGWITTTLKPQISPWPMQPATHPMPPFRPIQRF